MIKHEIVNLIDIQEVEITGAPGGDSHLVIEKSMETDGLDANLLVHTYQILPPLFPQAHNCPVGSGSLLPKVGQRTALPVEVDRD
jgi:hypothetical protein